ncbi:hypothetical protein PMAYCL1PPCAC_16245 [Pristionchus mayeri]|uniref:Uncharacterized protein n=1 Tax=Pristionchus mayeri TaxID=1317129 RepID=A0AAN5HZ26_9BILA|nr:hypothetical protein PMAYCL1PPCAC_16245 [Pristionchus mayeri]
MQRPGFFPSFPFDFLRNNGTCRMSEKSEVVLSSTAPARDAVNDENRAPAEEREERKEAVFVTPALKSRRKSTSSKKKSNEKRGGSEAEDEPGPSASPSVSARAAAAVAAMAAAEAAVESQLDPSWSDEQKLRALNRKRDRLMQQRGTINARVDWKFPDLVSAKDGVNCEGAGPFFFTSHRRREMFEREIQRIQWDIRTGKTTLAQRKRESAKMRADLNDDLNMRIRAVENVSNPIAVAVWRNQQSSDAMSYDDN